MSDGTLMLRERRISQMVSQYTEGRDAAADAFALDETRTDFEELLRGLCAAKEQSVRLRERGAKVALPMDDDVIRDIRSFRELAAADPGAVGDRAAILRRSRAHVNAYTAAVRLETEAYVDRARNNTGQGMAEVLGQVGQIEAARRLGDALAELRAAAENLPYSDRALDAVDEAGQMIQAVLASLDEASGPVLGFVQRLIAANGSLPLDTLTCEELEHLVSSGAAKNFVVSARQHA